MAREIDYDAALILLADVFRDAEADFEAEHAPAVTAQIIAAIDRLMLSRTQAYREVLISCALARLLDERIDLTLPYVNQGEFAYNARTLTEEVVTPFLQEHLVPSSGPAVSRTGPRHQLSTGQGLADKLAWHYWPSVPLNVH